MPETYGHYHRLGQPGGPGCPVATLPVTSSGLDGATATAELWDAGNQATEIELLRTVAHQFGVQWGHDPFGWWAAVPVSAHPSPPQVGSISPPSPTVS